MNSKALTKIISVFIVLIFLFSLAGCGETVENNNQTQKSETTAPQTSASEEALYPIKTDVTLTYWMELPVPMVSVYENYGDSPLAKAVEERTGVKVKYIHPPTGSWEQIKEALILMLASGDLPDIIEVNWFGGYPGGPNKALSDGYIMKLNDTIDKYAPNLKKFLAENPNYDKMIKTDEKAYYAFPFIKAGLDLYNTGPIIRKDWLDDLGLQPPETIDEWYNVLKAFKDQKGAAAPFSVNFGVLPTCFGSGFDFTTEFYAENGKVKFGIVEPQIKDFFAGMKKWYAEGLLDKNFTVIDKKTLTANILNGKTGASFGKVSGDLGTWLQSKSESDAKFDLMGIPYPSTEKGKVPRFASKVMPYPGWGSAAITTSCKNVELAARFLDFGYTEQGGLTYNFGKEGESYTMVDGYPTFTDAVKKNTDTMTMTQNLGQYTRGVGDKGPFVQDQRCSEQVYAMPQQLEALKQWARNDFKNYLLPNIVLTPEESEEAVKILNDISTYFVEMYIKFVTGTESLDNFDQYTEQMKKLNAERLVQLYQQAYDRYQLR